MEQEGVGHHYDSANAAIWQATKEPPITHKHLCSIYSIRGEKVNNKLEILLLSRKDHVSISIPRSGHHPDLKYWLNEIGRALDTVCRKCGMGEDTVEHVMREFSRIHHPVTQTILNYDHPSQSLVLWELWKAKPDLNEISQLGRLI